MRDIPWFRPRRPIAPPPKQYGHSALLEAYLNEMDDAAGAGLFTRMYAVLAGELAWADDPYAPAPYRVVRGWDAR